VQLTDERIATTTTVSSGMWPEKLAAVVDM
jgi:hypothetical protein